MRSSILASRWDFKAGLDWRYLTQTPPPLDRRVSLFCVFRVQNLILDISFVIVSWVFVDCVDGVDVGVGVDGLGDMDVHSSPYS